MLLSSLLLYSLGIFIFNSTKFQSSSLVAELVKYVGKSTETFKNLHILCYMGVYINLLMGNYSKGGGGGTVGYLKN